MKYDKKIKIENWKLKMGWWESKSSKETRKFKIQDLIPSLEFYYYKLSVASREDERGGKGFGRDRQD